MRDRMILWISIIVVFIGAPTTSVHHKRDPSGMCTKNVSSWQLRYNVPHIETHKQWNGRSWVNVTTRNYTTAREYVKVWKVEKICCAGYYNKTGRCEPHCNPSCQNGNCTKPNYCTCHNGYEPSKKSNVCLKRCNYGEKRDRRTQKCVPSCDRDCVHGTCVSHNTCKCDKYFKRSDHNENVCISMCSEKCTYGTCTGYEQCTCYPGYRNVTDKYNCVPQCRSGCNGGRCHKPDECKCHEPEYRATRDKRRCEPVCRGCDHGRCTAPNRCICDTGYKWNSVKQRCDPQCPSGCKYGQCTAPDLCTCNLGYVRLNDTACRPARCNVPCLNGQCVADDYCKCDSGYAQSIVQNVTRCMPLCKNSCTNGVCVSPNNCHCNPGYYFNKITSLCIPICDIPCVNGFSCAAPNKCACFGTLKNITMKGNSGTSVEERCVSRGSKSWSLISSTVIVLVGIVYSFCH